MKVTQDYLKVVNLVPSPLSILRLLSTLYGYVYYYLQYIKPTESLSFEFPTLLKVKCLGKFGSLDSIHQQLNFSPYSLILPYIMQFTQKSE